jgi:hypothetical protein
MLSSKNVVKRHAYNDFTFSNTAFTSTIPIAPARAVAHRLFPSTPKKTPSTSLLGGFFEVGGIISINFVVETRMVAGYDLEAQEIWQYAKGRALREKRALSIDDLVLGALAVLKQRQPELELPEEYEQQIRELTKPDADQREPPEQRFSHARWRDRRAA